MQASQPDFDPPTNALHSVSPVFSLHLEDTALKTFFFPSVYRRVWREPINTQTFSTTHLEGGKNLDERQTQDNRFPGGLSCLQDKYSLSTSSDD